MNTGTRALLAGATITASILAVTEAPAFGATGSLHYSGVAGGSTASVVGGSITSGRTAATAIDTYHAGVISTNTSAGVQNAAIVSTGTVSTSVRSLAVAGGGSTVAHAQTEGVKLLSGAISAKAVDTKATVRRVNGVLSKTLYTSFVGLRIHGKTVTARTPQNFMVKIPGIAMVTLNYQASSIQHGRITVRAAGAVITLLTGVGRSKAGSVVYLNPIGASIELATRGLRAVGGRAYVTQMTGNLASVAKANSGPTAASYLPNGGTQGKVRRNDTVGFTRPRIVTGSVVGTSAQGVAAAGGSYATLKSHIANLNVLGGMITADAIDVSAHAAINGNDVVSTKENFTFVNLVINGKTIAVTAADQMIYRIPNVAIVYVNTRTHANGTSYVRGLNVRLLASVNGLPAGANVEVAVASARVAT